MAGGTSIVWFLVGMLAIDLALQGVHISNQNVIYQLAPEARSRLNAVYMTTYFTGAALGSALGSAAWQRGGWSAACLAGVGVAGLNALAMVHDARLARVRRLRPRRRPDAFGPRFLHRSNSGTGPTRRPWRLPCNGFQLRGFRAAPATRRTIP